MSLRAAAGPGQRAGRAERQRQDDHRPDDHRRGAARPRAPSASRTAGVDRLRRSGAAPLPPARPDGLPGPLLRAQPDPHASATCSAGRCATTRAWTARRRVRARRSCSRPSASARPAQYLDKLPATSSRVVSASASSSPGRSRPSPRSSSPTSRSRCSTSRSAPRSWSCSTGSCATGASRMLYITHDLLSARLLADEVIVLNKGVVVEHGPTLQVIGDAQDDYTRTAARGDPPPGQGARPGHGGAARRNRDARRGRAAEPGTATGRGLIPEEVRVAIRGEAVRHPGLLCARPVPRPAGPRGRATPGAARPCPVRAADRARPTGGWPRPVRAPTPPTAVVRRPCSVRR